MHSLSRYAAIAALLSACSSPSISELNAADIGPAPDMEFAKAAIVAVTRDHAWDEGAVAGHWPDALIRGWFRERGEHRVCWAMPVLVQGHNAWGVPAASVVEFYFVDGALTSWCPEGDPVWGISYRISVWPPVTPENVAAWKSETRPREPDDD